MAFTRNSSTSSARRRTKIKQYVVVACGLFLGACILLPASAQTTKATSAQPAADQGVAFPPSQSLQTVRQDITALAILRSYQTAVGKLTWTDLEATGEMIPEALRSRGNIVTQDATLWILGHRAYRLDIQTPKGPISIRMDGAYGAIQPPGGHIISMNPRDAVSGLFAFPRLQSPTFPGNDTSIIDQGTVLIDGVKLHRITVEVPWTNIAANEQKQSGVSITDLYFDSATHLLVKSANILQGTDPRLARYMKIVTYGDYRPMGGVQLPFLLSESLNGRRIWTLQLNHVQFNRGIMETEFHF